jgi:hypothetical protein
LQLSFSIWSPSTRKINPNPLIPETAGPQRKQTPSKKQEGVEEWKKKGNLT